jgi:hypothetical protein
MLTHQFPTHNLISGLLSAQKLTDDIGSPLSISRAQYQSFPGRFEIERNVLCVLSCSFPPPFVVAQNPFAL